MEGGEREDEGGRRDRRERDVRTEGRKEECGLWG